MSKKSDDARRKERKRTQGAAAKLYRSMTPEQQQAYRGYLLIQ
jgi:hypothetical protein